jgi:transposase
LILRRNPDTLTRARQRRADQEAKVRHKVKVRNEKVRASSRCEPEVSLKQAWSALKVYKLDRFVTPKLEGREVQLVVDEKKKADVELLDGCYALETDTAPEEIATQIVHDRYMDLQSVERDFRSMKTVDLELRPIYLRKANRTRAHALVTMLALKLTRRLQRHLFDLGITAKDAIDRLNGIRLVTLAHPALGLWCLPARFTEVQREILDCLPKLPPPKLSPNPAGPRRGGRTRTPS